MASRKAFNPATRKAVAFYCNIFYGCAPAIDQKAGFSTWSISLSDGLTFLMRFINKNSLILADISFYTALFSCSFLYFMSIINTPLHYVMQEPSFRFDTVYFTNHLSYPGGAFDIAGSFITQFFVFPAVGAAVISLHLLLLAIMGRKVIHPVKHRIYSYTLMLVPAVLLAILQSNYNHNLSISIGFTASLLSFILYRRVKTASAYSSAALFLSLGVVLYCFSAGNFLLFALMCLIQETAKSRRYSLGVFILVTSALLPYVFKETLFLVSTSHAYIYQLPFTEEYSPAVASYMLYAFFPACYLASKWATPFSRCFRLRRFCVPGTAVSAVVVLAAAGLMSSLMFQSLTSSLNNVNCFTLRMCRLIRQEKWDDILEIASTSRYSNIYSACAVGQALYHKGALSSSLFRFPQHFGANGLYLFFKEMPADKIQDPFLYSYRCDLLFDLGLINNSEQWGYESIATRGETPKMLKRLAQIHALKGEAAAAELCLSVLETIPLQKKWASSFKSRIQRQFDDPELEIMAACIPIRDFIVQSVGRPVLDVERLVNQRPFNRMACEYSRASYLLSGDLQKIAAESVAVPDLDRREIPRQYQEALILFNALDSAGKTMPNSIVNRAVMDDFNDFNRLMERYCSDPAARAKALASRYRHTYWYYYLYSLQGKKDKW